MIEPWRCRVHRAAPGALACCAIALAYRELGKLATDSRMEGSPVLSADAGRVRRAR